VPSSALAEVRAGNAFLADLGTDGRYEVMIHIGDAPQIRGLSVAVRCESGRLFVGPAELLTGGGLEPQEGDDGRFFDVASCPQTISLVREGAFRLRLWISPAKTNHLPNAVASRLTL
jgi:hypothetical protein